MARGQIAFVSVMGTLITLALAGAAQHAYIITDIRENKWNMSRWKPIHSSKDIRPSPDSCHESKGREPATAKDSRKACHTRIKDGDVHRDKASPPNACHGSRLPLPSGPEGKDKQVEGQKNQKHRQDGENQAQ